MHLKVFVKLKKTLKTLSSGQKTQKNPKNPKKPTGLVFFFLKPGFFPTLDNGVTEGKRIIQDCNWKKIFFCLAKYKNYYLWRHSRTQCGGSGMFLPDPGSWFLPIPDPGSRIWSKNSNKRQGRKKIFCQTIFCSHKFHKTEYYFIFDMLKKKIWLNFPRITEVFTQKIVTKP